MLWMIFYAFFMLYKGNVCSQFIDFMQVPSSYLSIYIYIINISICWIK
jgi:hypothetical protein